VLPSSGAGILGVAGTGVSGAGVGAGVGVRVARARRGRDRVTRNGRSIVAVEGVWWLFQRAVEESVLRVCRTKTMEVVKRSAREHELSFRHCGRQKPLSRLGAPLCRTFNPLPLHGTSVEPSSRGASGEAEPVDR
jgi:hypothetical protein